MAKLFSLARVVTSTTGTGATIALGAAVSGYLTFAGAGVSNGDVIAYAIKDGANSEVGTATYSSTGPQLTGRTPTTSTNANAAINLSGSAEIAISPRKEDLLSISETQTANRVLAGPASGSAAAPAFRALVEADIPNPVKAFVKFTGAAAISSSYNVSSITKPATGIYRVNFTNAMPNTNYVVVVSGAQAGPGNVAVTLGVITYTTGYFEIESRQNTSDIDFGPINAIVMGG